MKRICRFSVLCLLCAAPLLRAQDAPTTAAAVASRQEAEENYNTLKGHVDDLLAAQADAAKQMQSLRKEIAELREQLSRPSTNYASVDALKQLADTVEEIDKKREADKDLILKAIQTAAAPAAHGTAKPPPTEPGPKGADADQPGFYYIIKKDDTLGIIAQGYRDQGVKVTSKQIEDANPNVNPAKLHVGTKLFIPAPKNSTGKP